MDFLTIIEFVVCYLFPLFESMQALKKQSEINSPKKWASYWGIQVLCPSFTTWFGRFGHLLFTIWLYHHSYNGSLYICELVNSVLMKQHGRIAKMLSESPFGSFKLVETPQNMVGSRVMPQKTARRVSLDSIKNQLQ